MARLAEPIDALIQAVVPAFDVLVVGSGYGGSVAARRCAEEGLATALFERGREYLPGDFPRDTAIAPGQFRIDSGGPTIGGYDDALFDVHVGDETVVLSGNGLGGGSLINAGVALTPDPAVFAQEEWPLAIRTAPQALVDRCEQAARDLHAKPYKSDPCSGVRPAKTKAFEAFAAHATRDVREARITVNTSDTPVTVPGGHLQPCTGCGDCVSGCNYGAKATLTETYLAAAYSHGARLFVNASVVRVARAGTRWRVTFTRTTDQRAYQRAQARLAEELAPNERQELERLVALLEHEIDVAVVVLAAGALGSTEILQRSRSRDLPLSWTLGSRFSGNGDYLSFGYWQRDPVDAVGWGSTGNRTCPGTSAVPPHPATVGPTITRIARFRDPDRLAGSFVVEDAAVPGVLADIFHELVTSAAMLHQLTRWSFKGRDPIARAEESARRTQVFLTMGHDGSRGRIELGDHRRARVQWPTLDADANFAGYDARIKAVERLGAVYLPNPMWTPIPPSMEKVLAGARFRGRNAIVHPLGGCPMGDDGYRGTVNDVGAVFATSSGTAVHAGLFVLDGAIVPTSLGANPFLTITALAERAMKAVIASARNERGDAPADDNGHVRTTRPPPPLVIPRLPRAPASPVPATLHEVLRGDLRAVAGRGVVPLAACLTVALPTPDLRAFLADPQHLIDARATLQLSPLGPGGGQLGAWRYAEAVGRVTILEPVRVSVARRMLDTVRVLATWLIERGANEAAGAVRNRLVRWLRRLVGLLAGRAAPPTDRRESGAGRLMGLVVDTLRLAWHAADRRQMQYHFVFALASRACSAPDAPATVILHGGKDVQYAASWPAIGDYLVRRLAQLVVRLLQLALAALRLASRDRIAWMAPPRLERRNLWRSLTELDVRLHTPGVRASPFAAGRLRMAPVEMLDERPPQVRGEATSGLLGIAGYPLLFARYLLKCRLWDFRLPDYTPMPRFDYPRAPGTGAAARVHVDQRLPPLRDASGRWVFYPEAYPLDVPLPADGAGSPRVLPLVVWRYRNPVAIGNTKDGARQCRSILLVHAFAQSAICFVEPTLRENLAEHLHREGWDVWLLEHRISIGLPSAHRSCSMDDIAQYDIPSAIRLCLQVIRDEGNLAADVHLQMYALAQCVGSAALGMAVLGGMLADDTATAKQPPPKSAHMKIVARQPSLLAGVVFSQFTPYVIGAAGSQFRSFLPTILRDVFGIREVDFAAPAQPNAVDGAGDVQAPTGQTDTLIDRLLATLGRDEKEHCWDEHQGRGATQVHASCRRMTGIEAPLFRHANLARATHDRLPLLLGVSNIGVFAHARRCVEQERLVNADGLNVYVDGDNIQKHLHMPVAFLHGARNELFSVGSSRRSHAMVQDVFSREHAQERVHLVVFPGYGHVDWLLGKDAADDCYPRVVCFLRSAWRANETSSCNEPPKTIRKLPLARLEIPAMGPLVGAVRAVDGDMIEANVWMRPHDGSSAVATHVVIEYVHAGRSNLLVYPITEAAITVRSPSPSAPPVVATPDFRIRYAVARLRIPVDHLPASGEPLRLQMLSIHPLPGWRKRASWQVTGTMEARTPLDLADPAADFDEEHGDKCAAWRNTLMAVEEGKRYFDAWRELIATRLGKLRYRIQRTARTTLSRNLLRLESLDDATFELRRTWIRPAHTTTFLATNCRYPGFATERHRVDATYVRLLERERARTPADASSALVLVGDQIYADATAGLFDVQTPIEKFEDRYRGLFVAPAVRRVVRRMPTYMAVDDHEIDDGWDSSDTILDPPLSRMAIGSARVHQWSHSSVASQSPTNADLMAHTAGLVHEAQIGGIPALFLDTRTLRDGRRSPPQILTRPAWGVLRAWLRGLADKPGPKLIVTGSPIAPGFAANVDRNGTIDPFASATDDNWQRFDEERRHLFDFIVAIDVRDVVLLSGDYHCSAVAQVRKGRDLVATAILAPPSYAPFDYANRRAADLAPVERTGPYEIRIARDEQGLVRYDGSGYARIAYCATSGALTVEFELCRVVDGKDPANAADWTSRIVTLHAARASAAAVAGTARGN